MITSNVYPKGTFAWMVPNILFFSIFGVTAHDAVSISTIIPDDAKKYYLSMKSPKFAKSYLFVHNSGRCHLGVMKMCIY